jgi:hypothetical protein
MRRFILLAALVLVAAPLEAQKKPKRDPYKISAEELAEFGEATMSEVIPRVRPNFLSYNSSGSAAYAAAEQTVTGRGAELLVYIGTMNQGDSSVLRFYKASDIAEVRYYKPGNSMSPNTSGNAYVIQLQMKDRLKHEDD